MLGSGSGIFRRFLAIAFVEAINASRGIDQLLFSSKERMARGTDFDVQVTFASRAGLECFAASAGDRDFNVFGVDSWFHLLLRHSPIAAPGRIFQTFYDRGAERHRQVYRGISLQRRKDVKSGSSAASGLPLRLCAFAGKVLRISFPKHAFSVALNARIPGFESLLCKAAISLRDFHP